jgi:hypothetical protein
VRGGNAINAVHEVEHVDEAGHPQRDDDRGRRGGQQRQGQVQDDRGRGGDAADAL